MILQQIYSNKFYFFKLIKYLDAEVVAGLLPVHLAVGDVEEVLDANFVSRRNLKKRHSSGNVLVLSHPVG